MGTHTPTPYSLHEMGNGYGYQITASVNGSLRVVATVAAPHGGAGIRTKTPKAKANALFILKCVNGWDEQQAKIDELVGVLETILDAPIIYTGAIEESIRTCGMGGIIEELLKSAEAALTRAKGE